MTALIRIALLGATRALETIAGTAAAAAVSGRPGKSSIANGLRPFLRIEITLYR